MRALRAPSRRMSSPVSGRAVGFNLVDVGVSGVETARDLIEAHLAVDMAAQVVEQGSVFLRGEVHTGRASGSRGHRVSPHSMSIRRNGGRSNENGLNYFPILMVFLSQYCL